MADEQPRPPDPDPGAEISEHVNDYLESLRSRFNELTDRIEEASRTSIDRGRAELEEMLSAADPSAAPTDDSSVAPPSEPIVPDQRVQPGEPSLGDRLRRLAPQDGASANDRPEARWDDSPPASIGSVPHDVRDEPGGHEAPPPAAPMPRPVNSGSERRSFWLIGALLLLVLLAAAFVAGRLWSADGGATATPTTLATQVSVPPTQPSDASIRADVIGAVDSLSASGVTADVSDGVVTLTGPVPDAETRDALSSAVRSVTGVAMVDNRVDIVAPTEATQEELQDAADEARIETGFAHLNVTVVDAVATISGVVGVDTVATGVFGSIEPLRIALEAIDGIDAVVTRIQLRGDEAALRAELESLTEATPIIFASNSADLDAAATATLDEAARIIVSYPGLRVLIAGHTDAAGSSEQNETLATARGQAVLGYLISQGVPVTRLQVVSYGELFPGGGSEQSLNRRIEFEVAP